MPTFTPVYLNPASKPVNRGLVQGFSVTDVTVDAYAHVGRLVTWTIGVVTAVIAMREEFYTWNSGMWPLGDVMSIPECNIFVSGSEVDAGAFFYWDWLPSSANIVICGSIFFPASPFTTFPLPPAPTDYWLTLPPLP